MPEPIVVTPKKEEEKKFKLEKISITIDTKVYVIKPKETEPAEILEKMREYFDKALETLKKEKMSKERKAREAWRMAYREYAEKHCVVTEQNGGVVKEPVVLTKAGETVYDKAFQLLAVAETTKIYKNVFKKHE